MPRAGQFRDRVTIERQADGGTLDAYGNPTAALWVELVTLWGDLRETPGREDLAAGRVEARASATLRLRYNGASVSISPADRVRARGQVWAILGEPIDPDGGRRERLEFRLEKGGNTE